MYLELSAVIDLAGFHSGGVIISVLLIDVRVAAKYFRAAHHKARDRRRTCREIDMRWPLNLRQLKIR